MDALCKHYPYKSLGFRNRRQYQNYSTNEVSPRLVHTPSSTLSCRWISACYSCSSWSTASRCGRRPTSSTRSTRGRSSSAGPSCRRPSTWCAKAATTLPPRSRVNPRLESNPPTNSLVSVNDLFAYEYDYFPSESDEDNQLDFPFLERDTANSFLPIRSRRRRAGIVNECCRNPCTLQHLSLYCGS